MMFGAAVAISRLHTRVCPTCKNVVFLQTFKQFSPQGSTNFKLFYTLPNSKNLSNWKSTTVNRSWSRFFTGWKYSRQILSTESNILKRFQSSINKINPLSVNTNIKNNVMLFRYEKDMMLKSAMLFSIIATFACLFMADNVYLVLCNDLFNEEIPLKTRLYDHIFPLCAITVGILAGPIMIIGVWVLTKRTVKYVILHKGGKTVTFVTYHPIFKNQKMTVPLEHVNCQMARNDSKSYCVIKLKNNKKQYVLDKGGHFVNPELFDGTIGIAR